MTVTTDLDRPVIDLTTVGRVTGRPHTIEIWFAYINSTIYMLSGGGTRSDWVRNLIRTPAIEVHAGGRRYTGTGRVVSDPNEDRIAREAVHDKYVLDYSGDLTAWRETALVIAVDLHLSKGD